MVLSDLGKCLMFGNGLGIHVIEKQVPNSARDDALLCGKCPPTFL